MGKLKSRMNGVNESMEPTDWDEATWTVNLAR